MIGSEQALKAIAWYYNATPQAPHWQLLQGNKPIDCPNAYTEHSRCVQLTQRERLWFAFQDRRVCSHCSSPYSLGRCPTCFSAIWGKRSLVRTDTTDRSGILAVRLILRWQGLITARY